MEVINSHHKPIFMVVVRLNLEYGRGPGLCTEGHHVKVSNELQEIGLLIAAAFFVLYSMG